MGRDIFLIKIIEMLNEEEYIKSFLLLGDGSAALVEGTDGKARYIQVRESDTYKKYLKEAVWRQNKK